MGEPRRIELMPAGPLVKEKKPEKNRGLTIRFNLSLGETTDQKCTEVSYVELLRNALEKKKAEKEDPNKPALDPDDPFAEQDEAEHDKLLAIAASFEQKYGPKPGKKKNKLGRIQDLVDLGDGYDESDPFVDNSEAYDEIVPACLTTKLGGFYINSGVLDFREVSDDSDDDFTDGTKKKRKRKRITSDSEGEGEEKKKRGPKKKKFKEDGEKIKKKKKKLSTSSLDGNGKGKDILGIKKKRGRPSMKGAPPTVAELLKQQSLPSSQNGMDKSDIGSDSMNDIEGMFGWKVDSSLDILSQGVNSPDGEGRSASPHPENAPKLPDSVTSTLIKNIDKLKQAASDSEKGKCKFFTPNVNRILLEIELQARELAPSARQTMYAHLTAFLPCGQQTLMKRAKKLRLNAQDDRLREPIQKLKEAISRAMPALLEKHQQDVLVATQQWEEKSEADKAEKDPKEASTESDDEGSKGADSMNKKRFMGPRKKFKWNPELVSLLCDVVRIKMECYEVSKVRAQSPEEYLKAYLEAEVKPLWPKGWMQTRMLFKESRTAHSKWTNMPLKPKKPVIVPTKPASTTPVQATSGLLTSTLNTGSSASSTALPSISSSSLIIDNQQVVNLTKPTTPTVITSSTPTLLDYASASFMSSAKGKTFPQTTLAMGTTLPQSSISLGTTIKSSTLAATKVLGSSPPSMQSPAGSVSVNVGAKVTNSNLGAGHCMKTPAVDALKSAISSSLLGSQEMNSPSNPTNMTTTKSSYMSQFQEFAKKFHEKAALIPKPSVSHHATTKSSPPRSPPASKTSPVSSLNSNLSPKAKLASVSSSLQGTPQGVVGLGIGSSSPPDIVTSPPKVKPVGSLGFPTSQDTSAATALASHKTQLQHAQVTSSSAPKHKSSGHTKPTSMGQSMEKTRPEGNTSNLIDHFTKLEQTLCQPSSVVLNALPTHIDSSSNKSKQSQGAALSSTQKLSQSSGQSKTQGLHSATSSLGSNMGRVASTLSSQRTSPSSTTPVYTRASTASKDTTTSQSFPGFPNAQKQKLSPTKLQSSAHKSSVTSSQHREKTTKLAKPDQSDNLFQNLGYNQLKATLGDNFPVSIDSVEQNQAVSSYGTQGRLSSSASTSYSRHATQATTTYSKSSVHVSDKQNYPTQAPRLSTPVSSHKSQQVAPSVPTQSHKNTSHITASHSKQTSALHTGGHSRPTSAPLSRQNSLDTSPSHSRQPESTHSRQSSQSLGSHARPGSQPTSTSLTRTNPQNARTSSTHSHQSNIASSRPTNTTGSTAQPPRSSANPLGIGYPEASSSLWMNVDSSSAFSTPSISISSPVVTASMFLPQGSMPKTNVQGLPLSLAQSPTSMLYPSVQLTDIVQEKSRTHSSPHSAQGMPQMLSRSPDSLLGQGSAIYGSPHGSHSLQTSPQNANHGQRRY